MHSIQEELWLGKNGETKRVFSNQGFLSMSKNNLQAGMMAGFLKKTELNFAEKNGNKTEFFMTKKTEIHT